MYSSFLKFIVNLSKNKENKEDECEYIGLSNSDIMWSNSIEKSPEILDGWDRWLMVVDEIITYNFDDMID